MKWLAGLLPLLLTTPALADSADSADSDSDSAAELEVGLGLLGRSIRSQGSAVRPFESDGLLGVAIAGDVYVSQRSSADLGFYFSYVRAPGLKSAIIDGAGDGFVELDTHLSNGELGAVARRGLGGGVGLRARFGMGRSQLAFDESGISSPEPLPASDFRFLQLAASIDKRFDILRVGGGLNLGRAFDLAGAPAEVMGETGGVVYGGHAGVGLALNPSVQVQADAGVLWLSAGDWSERQTRLEIAVGVKL